MSLNEEKLKREEEYHNKNKAKNKRGNNFPRKFSSGEKKRLIEEIDEEEDWETIKQYIKF